MAGVVKDAELVDVERGYKPTRKWMAAQATALGGLIIMLVTGNTTVTDPEKVAVATFVVQAITTYLVPNTVTPTGVPDAKALYAATTPRKDDAHA